MLQCARRDVRFVPKARRLRASSRDGSGVVNRPPPPLNMLLSRHTRRREFIKLLGGAAATWSTAARAERSNQMRRIGVLIGTAANDTEGQARMAAFLQGLQELNWSVDRNVSLTV